MSLISNLSDKELSELCAIITPKELKEYFKKNPRAFNKIKPGFRPDSLSDNDIVSIIVANREDPFIEAFFDNNVPLLLKHIEESMPSFDEGQTTDYSELSKGLKQTPFSKTPSLYFKLTSRTYPNDTAKEVEKLMNDHIGETSKVLSKNMLMGADHTWLKMLAWGLWKGIGWSAIIYISSISGIDQQLYEAATVDGAGRFQRMWHITVPSLLPTFFVLLLMSIGNILSNGMDQYLVFENATNTNEIMVLDLYVYKLGLGQGQIPLSTVIGMSKSIVSVALLFLANGISKKLRGESIM